jgi:predicted ATPase/class 3 adenylate cyclase/DNA-binding CsgD family transcriptional regulator
MLFSDIEGSTALLNRLGDRYGEVLSAQRALLRAAFSAYRGRELGTEGDSFFVVFASAGDAVRCAVAAQRSLSGRDWPGGVAVRVRMGLHSGEPAEHAEDGYVGLDVHRAARIAAAAHGGQVVLSEATRQLVASRLPGGVSVRDLGWHWLKDLEVPERVYQLVAAGLAEQFPPLNSLGAGVAAAGMGGAHGFPAALTSFVGRDEPVREVAGLLEECRLVTVTGPGGVGKTRLAAQVARQVAGRFADGAWLVELAPVGDPGLVPAVVAGVLGLRLTPGAVLAEVLAGRQLLLVLDNCEHLAGAVAGLCGAVLSAADDVRVLATSREPVGVAGEACYRLPPLTVPEPGDLAGVAGSEAVRLFADRAGRADAHFVLDAESGPVAGQIVARLDGLPLAIELAAARVEALGLAQLLGRLDDRFALLAGAGRVAAARQRSLAATVDWSYQLLDEHERRVFRAVALFPGPFTLQAAEAVAGPDAAPAVLHLVDCSLLAAPRRGPDGRARYLMLETLRAFGAQRLAEAGERDAAAAAMAAFAVEVAEQAAAGLVTVPGELAAGRWLDAEDATVHQVLAWALEHDPGLAARLAAALAPWWFLRDRRGAGCPLLAAAASVSAEGGPQWCAVKFWLGALTAWSDPAASLGHLTAVRDALSSRGPGPGPVLARTLAWRAAGLTFLGRYAEAIAEARQALSMARQVQDPEGEAYALLHLGHGAFYARDTEGSRAWLTEVQRLDPAGVPGLVLREAAIMLAVDLLDAGQTAEAHRYCADAVAMARRTGSLGGLGESLRVTADLDIMAGRMDEARAHLSQAIELCSRSGWGVVLIECLDSCTYLCTATAQWDQAVTMWAACNAVLQAAGIDAGFPHGTQRREQGLRNARQALGPRAARAAEDRGAAMNLATATQYALLLVAEEPDHAPAGPRLSARERELVTLVAQGATNAQIAAQLHVSVRTVGSHLDRIRDKTGCRRRADLTQLALRAGLV